MNDPKQAATEVAEQAKQTVGQATEQAQHQAKSMVNNQLGQVCSSVETLADAVRSMGQQLREKDQDQLASLSDQAANQIDHLCDYVRDHDVDEMMGDVQTLARRQPMLFVGGAFFLGLMAARFLKSSRPDQGMDYRRYSGRQPSYGSGYSQRGYAGARTGYPYQSGRSVRDSSLYSGGTAGYGGRPGYSRPDVSGRERYGRYAPQSSVGTGSMQSGTGTTPADMAGVGARPGTSSPATTSGQRTGSGASSPGTSAGWGTSGSTSSGTSTPSPSTGQTTSGRTPGEGSSSQGSRRSEG
jgi:hypothetical protein